MKIFNTIRRKLLAQNKIKSYLTYAFGEILLVVLGIFIGLQVNKWSELRVKQNKITAYYERIDQEMDMAIELIEHNNIFSENLIVGLQLCQTKMQNGEIDSALMENLKYLSDNESQTFFFPVIDEFLTQGYLATLKDNLLRLKIQQLQYNRKQSDLDDLNLQEFDNHLLKPALSTKLNFQDIDFNSIHQSKTITHLHSTDYQLLANDIQFWNLITYRINIEKNLIMSNLGMLRTLRTIKKITQ